MKSVGFKEWAIVCDALGNGAQSVILRKGGIAEGSDGFAFRYSEFFLFPTFFHEQVEKTRLTEAVVPPRAESQIEIQFFAKVQHLCRIESWQTVALLEEFHILQPSVVRERFVDDRRRGIHAAFLRVFGLRPTWVLPNEKSYGGCRSWVQLPDPPPAMQFLPVIDDKKHAEIEMRFLSVIDQGKGIVRLPVSGLEAAASTSS